MNLNLFLKITLSLFLLSLFSCGNEQQEANKTKEYVEGESGEDEDFSGKVKLEIMGDFTALQHGTEIIMIDGIELKPNEIKIGANKLVATTQWQGAESIDFKVWLNAQGKEYKVNCYLEGVKLHNDELSTEVDYQGWSYCNYIYPESNE